MTDSEKNWNLNINKSTLILLLISFIENIHTTSTRDGVTDGQDEYCMAAYCAGKVFTLSKENCNPDFKVICGNLVVWNFSQHTPFEIEFAPPCNPLGV